MCSLTLDYRPACSVALPPHTALMDTVPITPPFFPAKRDPSKHQPRPYLPLRGHYYQSSPIFRVFSSEKISTNFCTVSLGAIPIVLRTIKGNYFSVKINFVKTRLLARVFPLCASWTVSSPQKEIHQEHRGWKSTLGISSDPYNYLITSHSSIISFSTTLSLTVSE